MNEEEVFVNHDATDMAFCVSCGRLRLCRPGWCHECLAPMRGKFRVNHDAMPPPPELDPDRGRRVAEYERRAAMGLPLFDNGRKR